MKEPEKLTKKSHETKKEVENFLLIPVILLFG